MTENQTKRFIGVLSKLVVSYNNRKHWIVGTSPCIAENDPTSHLGIRMRALKYHDSIIMHMRSACRKKNKKQQKTTKNNKIPNEQPAFRCLPAFGIHSQSLTNKLFLSFSNVFDHFRPCKRMPKHVFAGQNTQSIFKSLNYHFIFGLTQCSFIFHTNIYRPCSPLFFLL